MISNLKRRFIDPSKYAEKDEMVKDYGEESKRVATYNILHDQRLIIFLAMLMFLDVALLIVVLILEGIYPKCSLIEDSCVCAVESPTCVKSCIEPPHSVEEAILAMNITSIVILCVFLIEVIAQAICLGVKRFFGHLFLVLDALVIIASLAIEIYATVAETQEKLDAQAASTALLLLARSWRLVRISHSAFLDAHNLYKGEIKTLKEKVKTLEARLESTRNLQQAVEAS